jgi:diguanylate cyclase (GGDEF)-like protein
MLPRRNPEPDAMAQPKNAKTDRATILEHSITQETTDRPRLIVVSGLLLGHRVEIGAEPVSVGRAADCTLTLPHPSVSRLHCRVWQEGGEFLVEDLDSTNRTYVNGQPVTRAALRDGDQIGIGSNALKFFLGQSMEARYHDELIDLAIYDSLTGFYNRRRFQSLLVEEVERARSGRPLALLMLDLDYFKAINDRHGHLVGDQALSSVAQVLREHAPADAVTGRFGGEEFSMLLRGATLAQAAVIAEGLRAAVAAQPLALDGLQLAVSLSVGAAEYAGGDSAALLSAADEQLYRAKQAGRNRVAPG